MIQASMRQLVALLATGLLLAGCSTQAIKSDQAASAGAASTASETGNKEVEKRAMARWSFLIARDAAKAYDFLSPGFKATKKREDYAREMNNRPVRWEKVYPFDKKCDRPDVCVINLQVDSDVKMPGVRQDVASVGFVTETWIRTRGKWYLLPNTK